MHDTTRDPHGDAELTADPACCPSGACGPLFETPLLEVAFNRMLALVRGRRGVTAAGPTPIDHPDSQPHSRKDAPR